MPRPENVDESPMRDTKSDLSLRESSLIHQQRSASGDQASASRLQVWLFWSSVWLAFALVAIKGFHLGLAGTPAREVGQLYLRALAAISYADVVFVVLFWSAARATLALCAGRRAARLVVVSAFTAGAMLLCLYAVLNVVMFPLFGGFLTYPLLALVGDVRMLRSSVTTYLRPGFIAGLVCLPLAYVGLVWISATRGRYGRSRGRLPRTGDPEVRREPDAADRRSKLLWVTPQGAEVALKMKRAGGKVQQRILEPLSAAEREQLVGMLDRLVAGHEDEPVIDV